MPLFDLETLHLVTEVPFQTTYRLTQRMSSSELSIVEDKLNSMIDGEEIKTAGWMPGSDWSNTEFFPIYEKAAKRNQNLAARIFGLIVWSIFMRRPESWITGRFEKDGEPIGSRTYFRDRSHS
jgi:hypothetical protein